MWTVFSANSYHSIGGGVPTHLIILSTLCTPDLYTVLLHWREVVTSTTSFVKILIPNK